MPRDFYDPEDRRQEDIFERIAGDEHRARVAEAKVRNAAIDRQIAEEEAKAREIHRIKTLAHNASVIVSEYLAAGVAPMQVDDRGVPTVSLSLLLWAGWRIEEIDGKKKLVLPAPAGMRAIKQGRREDYDGNS